MKFFELIILARLVLFAKTSSRDEFHSLMAEVKKKLPIDTHIMSVVTNLRNKNKTFRDEYERVVTFGMALLEKKIDHPEVIEVTVIERIQGLIMSSKGWIGWDVDLGVAYSLSWKLLDKILSILAKDHRTWAREILPETYILMKSYIEETVPRTDPRTDPAFKSLIQFFDDLMKGKGVRDNEEAFRRVTGALSSSKFLIWRKQVRDEKIGERLGVLKNTADRMVHTKLALENYDDPLPLVALPELLPLQEFFTAPVHGNVIDEWPFQLRKLYDEQLAADIKFQPRATPYLIYDSEVVVSNDLNVVRIKLGDVISQKFDAMIFRVANEERVIKYQCNCNHLKAPIYDIHRDYWFQNEAGDIAISPRVYFLSPPAKFRRFRTPKTDFESEKHGAMSRKTYESCAADPNSQIRFMVMDLIYKSVDILVRDGEASPLSGLQMAISLIPKLKALHAKGIIHGDVHEGNIVILRKKDLDDFGLIDYGKAAYISEVVLTTDNRPYEPFCSASGGKGIEMSYRDDVAKTLATAAFLVTKVHYGWKCGTRPKTPSGISKNTFIFGEHIFNDDQMKTLHEALVLSLDLEPNYDEIVRLLTEVRDSYTPIPDELTQDIHSQ